MPKVKVNFLIEQETVNKLEALSRRTFRKKSDVIDWLVARAFDPFEIPRPINARMEETQPNGATKPLPSIPD